MFRRALPLAVLAVAAGCSQPVNSVPEFDIGVVPADAAVEPDTAIADSDMGDGTLCGNGQLDPGETCDTSIASGPEACPTECPSDECGTGELVEAGSCVAECVYEAAATCCGDGALNGAEACDTGIAAGMPGACPMSAADCDDGDPCTVDEIVEPGACGATCTNLPSAVCFGDGAPAQVPDTSNSAHAPEVLEVGDELWLFSSADNGANAAPVSWHRFDGSVWVDEGDLAGDTRVGVDALMVGARPTLLVVTGGNQPWLNAFNESADEWEWSTFNAESWHAVLGTGQTDKLAAMAAVDRRLFVFTTLDDGSLEFASGLEESNLEPYRTVPGGKSTSFGPAAFADGREVTVVTVGNDGLRSARYDADADSWTVWQDFGPAIDADTEADLWTGNGLTVAAVSSGGIAHITFSQDEGETWSEWAPLPAVDVVGRPSVAVFEGLVYVAVLRSSEENSYWLYTAPLP